MRHLTIWAAGLLLAASASAQVRDDSLEVRDGIRYLAGEPYTGEASIPGEVEGAYVDGKRDGQWTWWHENGRRSMTVDYDRNALDGFMRRWNEEGTLTEERAYRDGRREGTSRIWDRDGRPFVVRGWADGERHGSETWYYPDGSVRWETHYDRGLRDGIWRQFAADGVLIMETEWAADRVIARTSDPHAAH